MCSEAVRRSLILLIPLVASIALSLAAQDKSSATPEAEKARVFITDSASWEMGGYSGGSGGAGGGMIHGGARPQTAEIIKTFGQRCPQVMANNIQEKTDYIVLLDHEGGKGILRHKNKVAVFARVSGDSIVSKSTLSLDGSVQDACEAINKDWSAHGSAIRAATAAAAQAKAAAPQPVTAQPKVEAPAAAGKASTAKFSVVSIPDGADIEVDGSVVGNTPSEIEIPGGSHTISVKKTGFKDWERKLTVSSGSSVHLNPELEKLPSQ
jgi:hypothetical protein